MTGNHATTLETPPPLASGMTCRGAVELLPWLVNASLGEEERRLLLDHLAECGSCRVELAQTVEAVGIFSQHLPSFALAEYSQGLRPGEVDRERIEAHLAFCPACRHELELAGTASRVADFAAARAKRIGSALGNRRQWLRLAAAAVLAGACLGMLFWVGDGTSPRDQVARETSSQVLLPGADEPQVARPEPANAVLLLDDFESGGISIWSSPIFIDGFESKDIPAWSSTSESG